MKKFSFLVALLAVMAFATSAFGAQVILGTTDAENPATYKATVKAFTYDGKSNYPYEIYLPNENPQNYRIHSNYTKNTDACAACHATHTAVGNSLLQWYSVYETCMACHDGTVTTTYDVQHGVIGTTGKAAFGGMFGTTGDTSLSNHNVTGAMEIAAAPGGSVVSDATVTLGHGTKSNWSVEFGCESCHTPHGQGGNARILNPDANLAASKAAQKIGNKYYVSATGYVYADAAFTTAPVYILKGYPYSPAIKVNGTPSYTLKIDNSTGVSYVYGAPANTTIENGVAALQVKMAITDYLKPTENVEHKSGMNFFCGACHTDYNTAAFTASGSANMETGEYSKAHRHQVGFDAPYFKIDVANMVKENGKMECLTCHVAHGTSTDYWTRTVGSTSTTAGRLATAYITNDADLAEISGSSALKRLPNMGTCEACHGKGDGNQGYGANTAQEGYVNSAPTSADNVMPNTYIFSALTASWDASDKNWVGSAKCEPCHKEYFEGWKESKHATSSHVGATSCGRCHNPGNSIMGETGSFVSTPALGADAGITCESCHGTGVRHIAAPSSKNIFNPGKQTIERQAIECGRCHDMYANKDADTFGLAATSGTGAAPTGVYKTADLVNQANWSVAFRVYNEDPTKFAIASQKTATSNHFGGAWGYADSKHFLGNGTAKDPNGVVSCNTCHNQHSDKNPGLLKNSYSQVCSSCHDMTANLAQAVAMPTNNWNRHQLEANDFAHSFKFGAPATIAAMDVKTLNLEYATNGVSPEASTFHYEYKSAYSGTNLWRSGQLNAGGIGQKVIAYTDAAKTTQAFNNYAVKWELVAHPAGVVEGTDFEFVSGAGAIEFANPGTGNLADYAKYAGTYTLKYTSKANPAVTGTVSFTVVQ